MDLQTFQQMSMMNQSMRKMCEKQKFASDKLFYMEGRQRGETASGAGRLLAKTFEAFDPSIGDMTDEQQSRWCARQWRSELEIISSKGQNIKHIWLVAASMLLSAARDIGSMLEQLPEAEEPDEELLARTFQQVMVMYCIKKLAAAPAQGQLEQPRMEQLWSFNWEEQKQQTAEEAPMLYFMACQCEERLQEMKEMSACAKEILQLMIEHPNCRKPSMLYSKLNFRKLPYFH